MKRVLSLALTVAMILTVLAVGVVSASAQAYDTAIVVGGNTYVADVGETFSYTVRVKSTKALTAGQIEIPVDFTYLAGETADEINAKIDDVAPVIADTAEVQRFDQPSVAGLTGYVVNFATDGDYDFSAEQAVITLNFTVLKQGTISLNPTFREFLDDGLNEIVTIDGDIVDEGFSSSVAVNLPKTNTYAVKTPRMTAITSVAEGLKLEWGAVEGAPKYRVFRHNGSSWVFKAVTEVPEYIDTDVVSGESYLYTLRAVGETGKTLLSDLVSCGWRATYIAEPAVAHFDSLADGLKLTISETSGAAGFRVYRKDGDVWNVLGTTASHEIKDTNVAAGTQYTYSIAAVDDKGREISSRSADGFSAYYLGAPVLKSVANGVGCVTVSWNKMNGAAKYRVFRKDPDTTWYDIADTTALSYNDKVVTSGKKYTYTVRCISADGSEYTSPYDVTGMSVTYVAAPAISKISCVYGGVSLTWSKSNGAAKYRVLRKTGAKGSWAKVVDTTSVTYTDKTVKNNTTYVYTIRCLNNAGAFNSSYNATGKTIKYLAAPALKSVANIYGGVRFSWTKVTGAVKYRVYRKAGKGAWVNLGATANAYFDDKKAASGTKYTYTVCCVTKDGKTVTSGYNATGKTITYVAAPALKSVAKSGKAVKFVWTKPKGAVKFRIFRKVGNGKWAKLADTTATSFVDKKVKTKTKYTYTVCCITANGKTVVSAYNPTGKAITYK